MALGAAYSQYSQLTGKEKAYLRAHPLHAVAIANALAFTSAHEDFLVNPESERMMDLHNNRVEIQIGASADSNAGLSRRCMSALKIGHLKLLKK